ncbi:unnamed protein product, partial [Brassica oleracea]
MTSLSTCTSSPTKVWNYDVFISFRGDDTRDSISSHLYKALDAEGIRTFLDDRELEPGDKISGSLVDAIQTSRFAVVVLSENYATSNWCLEELRQIMDLSSENQITVVPIFYKVEPADVRYQKGSFEAAFTKKRYTDPEQILKWKGALTQVGNLSGKHPTKGVNEATMVADIVSSISRRLENMKPIHLLNLVGREAHLEKMEAFLDKEPKSEVRMIGILGMGGIGKTAIAKYLYNQFSLEFSVHCFIKDAWKINDPDDLQREFLSHIRNEVNTKLLSREARDRKIKDILGHKRVFLVIDGVDNAEQVHALAKERSWFGPGSRIIITTRDRGLLNSCGVNDIHEVNCLDDKDALSVFEKLAFGGRPSPFHGPEKLFIRASRLAHGLPAALVAFASHLSEQTTMKRWEEELSILEEYNNHEKVQEILRASYNGLDQYDKTVFLQVACLFNGSLVWLINAFLGKSSLRIPRLVEKSLLDISDDGRLIMHVLVEQTGKEIVRQESNFTPCNQKFLWGPKEIYDVLSRNIGTNVIEGVSLHMCDMSDTLNISSSAFKPMNYLTFLNLLKHVVDTESKLQLMSDVSVSDTTHRLKLLHWDAYPLETLPLSFRSPILVELNLRYSKLKYLWDESDEPNPFPNLRRLDVTGSTNLVDFPDLSRSLRLEELIMEGCKSLKQTPGSIDRLHLRKLNIDRCDSLVDGMEVHYLNEPEGSFHRRVELFLLDQRATLSSLTDLSIQGKINVALLHTLTGTAERLSFTSEEQIPEELIMMLELKTGTTQLLHLFRTLVIERLDYVEFGASFTCHSFSNFPCLTELKLTNLNIRELPEDIDCLLSLRTIDLTGNDFVHLPKTTAQLTKLEYVTLRNCRHLDALPQLTLPRVDNQARGLLELCIDNCKNLRSLQDQLLCYYTSLAYLDLSNHEFERMPTSISELSLLTTLYLNNCKKLKSVEELPQSLNHLYAQGCDSLESVALSPDHMIKHIDLRDCPLLKPYERIRLLSSNERHGRPVSFLLSTLFSM